MRRHIEVDTLANNHSLKYLQRICKNSLSQTAYNLTFEGWNCTLHSCIARESNRAGTHRLVIDGLAERIDAACGDARISTLLREAGLVARTIGVNDALGIDANRDAIPHSAFAVVITRRRAARIGF